MSAGVIAASYVAQAAYASLMAALAPSVWLRTNGNLNDASGNGRNFTAVSFAFPTGLLASDPSSTAFRGEASLARQSWMDAPTSLSWCFWHKNGGPNVHACWGRSNSGSFGVTANNQWRTYHDGANYVSQIFDATGFVLGSTSTVAAATTGSPTRFVAVTWDGTNLRTYINGALANTVAVSGAISNGGLSLPMYLGAFAGNAPMTNNAVCVIDEPAVWYGTVLTATNISDLYAAG